MHIDRRRRNNGIRLNGPSDGLKGLKVDMNDFSDQALTLAAIAPYASSDVTITHMGISADRNAIDCMLS